MSNYEIFDLLYSDVIKKFDAENRVFTHKYVVGKQRIRIHLLKPDEETDPFEILDFSNKLQENMLAIVTGVLFTSAVIP